MAGIRPATQRIDPTRTSRVNLAARIQPMADPGGICISEDTYRLVKTMIDISVSSLGTAPQEHRQSAGAVSDRDGFRLSPTPRV
jgi:class 3 adenylate cyclase